MTAIDNRSDAIEFRQIKHWRTGKLYSARLYRGGQWLGTVWPHLGGWAYCLIIKHPKIIRQCADYEDGVARLVADLRAFEADENQQLLVQS